MGIDFPFQDAKIRQHTESSIARKTPGIKALARRFNGMCEELQTNRKLHPHATIPAPLDINQLFNPEVNAAMWNDAVFHNHDGDAPHELPDYLVYSHVQEGILGWLSLQRLSEEQSRLLVEVDVLIAWVANRINSILKALQRCTGKHWVIGLYTLYCRGFAQ